LAHFKLNPTEIVSGGAKGVDASAEWFAEVGKRPFKLFPADWDKHGKSAGPLRNREMAQYGDALLLIWDGKSPGSANMKAAMHRLKKPVYEIVMPVKITP
jgi:hypothetical protein